MENGLDAELDDELGYSRYDYKNKNTNNSRDSRTFGPIKLEQIQFKYLFSLF